MKKPLVKAIRVHGEDLLANRRSKWPWMGIQRWRGEKEAGGSIGGGGSERDTGEEGEDRF